MNNLRQVHIDERVFAGVRSCVVDDKEGWTRQVWWRGRKLGPSLLSRAGLRTEAGVMAGYEVLTARLCAGECTANSPLGKLS
jgi:hypothetical protein